jgi:hypothetical protein
MMSVYRPRYKKVFRPGQRILFLRMTGLVHMPYEMGLQARTSVRLHTSSNQHSGKLWLIKSDRSHAAGTKSCLLAVNMQ